ncbi:class I SAM-dependent methyltransferase [Clostridiaceae bacterium M8S5]|nr:class I SAM-dependent methyltransferase [Clostridiaceae bacterium M8S5]
MINQHNNIIWGKKCTCGQECFILQNKYHPWDEDVDMEITIVCNKCNNKVTIDRESASLYYDNKIYSYFKDIKGHVLDIGCGGGFLSRFILNNLMPCKVYGLDVDEGCIEELNDLAREDRFNFNKSNIKNIKTDYKDVHIDYIVCRDVLMFIENIDNFIDDISNTTAQGLRFMGWYIPTNKRIKNNVSPDEIALKLKERGWSVNVEYLDWYKSGYFINCDR